MAVEIRAPREGEIPTFVHVSQRHTGRRITDEEIAAAADYFGFDRALAAWDDGHLVATALTAAVELTVAGPAVARAAVVTACATLPTHRRRGLLRTLLTRLLEEARSRGEPFAVLGAVDSAIYGRFGFGVAATAADYSINVRGTTLRSSSTADCVIRLLGAEEAARTLPPLFDCWRRTMPGAISRHKTWWSEHVQGISGPDEPTREGSCALAVDPDGVPQGYVIYTLRGPRYADADGEPDGELRISEMVAMTPSGHLALWRHCIETDLIRCVRMPAGPVDEPLRWALTAPRRLATNRVNDALWLRLLDIEQALTMRGYDREDQFVLDISDETLPALAGRYELKTADSGARCTRTTAPPDLALDVADLASAYLGAATMERLAGAGRIRELTPGAVARAGAVFATRTAPYCNADL